MTTRNKLGFILEVKAHCAAASISYYYQTEQMQNLDWNKCFQRVSDAGLHFPLCPRPLVGMYLCSLPSDHPGRLGRRVHQHSSFGLVLLSEVDEGRCRYQTGRTGFGSIGDLDWVGFTLTLTGPEEIKKPKGENCAECQGLGIILDSNKDRV